MAVPAVWRTYRTRQKRLDDAEPDEVTLSAAAPDAAPDATAPDASVLDNTALDNPVLDNPVLDNPVLDNTALDDPVLDSPVLDNPVLDSTVLDSTAVDSASAGSTPPARRSWLRTTAGIGLNVTDGILAIGAGVMVVFVHDLKFWLSIPYWLDEAWVVDSVRAPLSLVPRLAATTPLGWILLLRLVPHGGLERQRLVPLIFAGLAVSAAYLLGRELGLTRFTAGLATATAALLSPAMLIRNDLKQYTAEAFGSIV